jgi:hypothetical protein
MRTDEFIKISQPAIRQLLNERFGHPHSESCDGRRAQQRWPFPGTIELWLPDPSAAGDDESHVLGRVLNLSAGGIGALLDEPVGVDQTLTAAIHQPEATLYGDVIVRHCAPTEHGFHVGMQFVF